MIDYRDLIIRLRSAQRQSDALAYGIFGAKRSILYDQAADAIEELQAQMPRWISVEERLPEEEKIVIAQSANTGKLFLAWIIGGEWWTENLFDLHVLRWMPLPAPPEEVGE